MLNLDLKELPLTQDKEILQNALVLIDHADYTLAVKLLSDLSQKQPDFYPVYQWLGYCYKQLGMFEKALEQYQACAHLNPSEESLYNLAEMYYISQNDSKALEFYKATLEHIDYESPFLFQIYKNIGNISVKQGDFEAAEENYDRAYTINPHSDDLFVNYGTLELQKQRYDLALERFRHALNLNFYNDKAWVGLSLIYRGMGDHKLAWGDLLKAIDINIHNQTALKLCVEWSLQDMNYEVAKDAVEKYLKENPTSAEWTYTLAGLYFQLGLWSEALSYAHKVLDINPKFEAATELIRILNMKLDN